MLLDDYFSIPRKFCTLKTLSVIMLLKLNRGLHVLLLDYICNPQAKQLLLFKVNSESFTSRMKSSVTFFEAQANNFRSVETELKRTMNSIL